MYWLRFSPAPPWQLEDRHPAAPTNWPGSSRPCLISVANAFAQIAKITSDVQRNTGRGYHPGGEPRHCELHRPNGRRGLVEPGFPAFANRFRVALDIDVTNAIHSVTRNVLDGLGGVAGFFSYRFKKWPQKRERKVTPVDAAERRFDLDLFIFTRRMA